MVTLFLDPGVTTGWSLFSKNNYEPPQLMSVGQVRGLTDLWFLMENTVPHRIVSESFRLYAHKSGSKTNSGFPEVEAIGIIRLWALLGSVEHFEQTASQAKLYGTDEVLRHLKLWQPNLKHANDSIRHAVLYYRLRKG